MTSIISTAAALGMRLVIIMTMCAVIVVPVAAEPVQPFTSVMVTL